MKSRTKTTQEQTASPASKQERFDAFAVATLRWIEAHGLARMNLTQISKRSGVSRAWIYKYIGSSQNDWILHDVRHFGAALGRFDSEPQYGIKGLSRDEWLANSRHSWMAMARLGRQVAWLLPLYFQYRNRKSGIAEPIRELEARVDARHARELAQVFGLDRPTARSMAELLTGLRSSLALYVQPAFETSMSDAEFEKLLAERADQYVALVTGLVGSVDSREALRP